MKATLYFDGACIGNPGPMGIGALLEKDGEVLATVSERLPGEGTNNIAEYTALIRGLEAALQKGVTEITIRGDSSLVVNQLLGKFRVTKPHLRPLLERVSSLAKEFNDVDVGWIPREQNARADALSMAPFAKGGDGGPKRESLGSKPSAREHSILCPKCKKPCTLAIQAFKDGSEHVRQECADHGFIGYAPNVEPFLTMARAKA